MKKLITTLALVATSGFVQAGTTVITFDEDTISGQMVDLKHGTVINDQYASLGVRVSTLNQGSGPDLGVLYDTSTGRASADDRDPDLTGPNWGNSNLADPDNYFAGNALIIQENSDGCGDGVCDKPDDQVGNGPGNLSGLITFDLDFQIASLGFDLIDFQGDLAAPEVANSRVILSNAMTNISYNFSDFVTDANAAMFGDNSINRIVLNSLGLAGINKVQFEIVGTGAIDNLRLGHTPPGTQVPEPTTLALFGAALLTLVRVKRKH